MKQTCKNCSTDFEAQRSTAQFCSDLCRVTFNRKKPLDYDAFKNDGVSTEQIIDAAIKGPLREDYKKAVDKMIVEEIINSAVVRNYPQYLREARITLEPEKLMQEAIADKKLTPAQRDMIRSKLKPQI